MNDKYWEQKLGLEFKLISDRHHQLEREAPNKLADARSFTRGIFDFFYDAFFFNLFRSPRALEAYLTKSSRQFSDILANSGDSLAPYLTLDNSGDGYKQTLDFFAEQGYVSPLNVGNIAFNPQPLEPNGINLGAYQAGAITALSSFKRILALPGVTPLDAIEYTLNMCTRCKNLLDGKDRKEIAVQMNEQTFLIKAYFGLRDAEKATENLGKVDKDSYYIREQQSILITNMHMYLLTK
ncbi:MAG: hypothetical protein V1859_05270 [archaeon]